MATTQLGVLLLLCSSLPNLASSRAAADARLAAAHVFFSSDASRIISASCASPCGFMAVDERGDFKGEGIVGKDGSLSLSPAHFGVGFYSIKFSRPNANGTTAAILRPPATSAAWPLADTPVAVDTAQSWGQPPDPATQALVSQLAAAAGCPPAHS